MEVLPTCNLLWKSLCIWLNHGGFYYLYFSVVNFVSLKIMKHERFAYQQYGVAVLVYLDKAVDDFAYLQFRVAILVYLTEDVEDLAYLQFGLAVWLTWLRRR